VDNATIVALCTLGGMVATAVFGAIAYLFRGWMASNDQQIAKAQAAQDKAEKERDTFRDLLRDAVKVLPAAVNNALERDGKPAMPDIAPIVPISHSPVTPEQERQAEMFTALAITAAAKLALGIPPRVAEPASHGTTTEMTVQEVAKGEPSPSAKKEDPHETIVPNDRTPMGRQEGTQSPPHPPEPPH
jgi:hypothetical protein